MTNSLHKKIAQNFGVTESQAKSLIAYHYGLSAVLNNEHAAMTVAKRVELKASTAAEIGTVAAGGLGAIPFVGELAASAATAAIKAGDRAYQMEKIKNFSHFSPRGDQSEWCGFTRDVADHAVMALVDKIKGMSEEEASKFGKKHGENITDRIADGKFNSSTIYDDESVKEVVNVVAPGKFSPDLSDQAASLRQTLERPSPSPRAQQVVAIHPSTPMVAVH